MSDATPEAPAAKEGDGHAQKSKAAGPAPLVMVLLLVGGAALGATLGALLIAPPVIHGRQKAALEVALAEAGGHGGDKTGAHASKKGKKDKKKKKEKKGDGHGGHGGDAPGGNLYKLDNLIVNPAGSHGDHFLMCSIAVSIEDEEVLTHLRDNEVQVRDAVITALESQTLSQLAGPGARDSLKLRIAGALGPLLGEDYADVEMKVYLPQFVIQ